MPRDCTSSKIINPKTGKCVLKSGKIGKEILAGKGGAYRAYDSDKTKRLEEELKQVRAAYEKALQNLRICTQDFNDIKHKHDEIDHKTQHSKQKDHYSERKKRATSSNKDMYRDEYNKEVEKEEIINREYLQSLKKHENLVQQKEKCSLKLFETKREMKENYNNVAFTIKQAKRYDDEMTILKRNIKTREKNGANIDELKRSMKIVEEFAQENLKKQTKYLQEKKKIADKYVPLFNECSDYNGLHNPGGVVQRSIDNLDKIKQSLEKQRSVVESMLSKMQN